MNALFDTSVLVAAIVDAHPAHARALPWLQKAHSRRLGYLVAAHSLAELYAVLSTLPVSPRITPSLARELIRSNVESAAKIVTLSASDYTAVVQRLADLSLPGGIVYDAIVARAAQKAKANRLLTLNPRDFLRAWPEGTEIITAV